MSLIGTGQGLRRKAQQGMEAVARLENQRNMQQSAIDAQEKAQEMQMYGVGMGIGGAYGVNKALAAKEAATGVGQMSAAGAAPVTETTAALGKLAPGVNTANTGNAGAALAKMVPGAQAGAGGGLASTGGAAVAGQSTAVGTGAAASTTTAAPVAGAATGSSGALATIGTIAAPLAIGLGAAFLLNKLFG